MMRNENRPKVSIVFPIYNNEKYLEKCIRSVMEQSLKEIEMILVDDGSKDSAPEICDKLAAEDSRIIVIHKKNEGSAAGRNLGIEMSKGEYIAFVESDDKVDPEMYTKLYQYALDTDADVIKCGFNFCEGEKREEATYFYDIAEQGQVFTAVEKPDILMYHASIWAGLYKASFIKDNNIRFVVTPSATYSDFSWMAATLGQAQKIAIYHEPLYNYTFDNPNSSFKEAGEKSFYMLFHCTKANEVLRRIGVFDKVKEEIGKNEFKACYGYAIKIRKDLRKKFFKEFSDLLKDAFGKDFGYKRFTKKEERRAKMIINGQYKLFYAEVDIRNKIVVPIRKLLK